MASKPVASLVGAIVFSIITISLVHYSQAADKKVRMYNITRDLYVRNDALETKGRREVGYRETGEKGGKQEITGGTVGFATEVTSTNG